MATKKTTATATTVDTLAEQENATPTTNKTKKGKKTFSTKESEAIEQRKAKEKAELKAQKDAERAIEKEKKDKERAEAKAKKDQERAEAKLQKEAEDKKKSEEVAKKQALVSTMFAEESDTKALALIDNFDIAQYEVKTQSEIHNLANTLSALDENGNPVIKGKTLLDLVNVQAVDDKTKFVKLGLIGQEIRRRVETIAGEEKSIGFTKTLDLYYGDGRLKQHPTTMKENTNIVDTFGKWLVDIPVENILPREHYLIMLTWFKTKDAEQQENLMTTLPAVNDGNPIKAKELKEMVALDSPKDEVTANGDVFEKQTKITFFVGNYGDLVERAIQAYGTFQMFVETALNKEFLLGDAPETAFTPVVLRDTANNPDVVEIAELETELESDDLDDDFEDLDSSIDDVASESMEDSDDDWL